MNDNCIFCRIVKGEIPCFKIYEDEKYLAFLDLAHFSEGHTLLIPKTHHPSIWDVENIGEYYEVAKKVANHFKQKNGYKYVDTATFGRDVPHSHIHLVPHNGDSTTDWEKALKNIGVLQQDQSRRLTKDEGERVVKKLKL